MSEQIIAAQLTRQPDGTVSSIIFDGIYFVPAPTDHDFRLRHFPPGPGDDPTRMFCPSDCPAYDNYSAPTMRDVDLPGYRGTIVSSPYGQIHGLGVVE